MANASSTLPVFGCLVLIFLVVSSFSSLCFALTKTEEAFIARRQALSLPKDGKLPNDFEDQYDLKDKTFESHRMKMAYVGLQAFKKAIYSDPYNHTENWVGTDVCQYNGVLCDVFIDNQERFVAMIDLNKAEIAAHLPPEMGWLLDLIYFHANTNRLCGIIPETFANMHRLEEFDVSNNRLVGPFPTVALTWKRNLYLDLRFNNFEGELPPELFQTGLDIIFLNHNWFRGSIPETIGESLARYIVLSSNNFTGCLPRSIGYMKELQEIILMENQLSGCLPSEIGSGEYKNLTVFDIRSNKFHGSVPQSFANLNNIMRLDISDNLLTGFVSADICKLPHLLNFTFSNNFFQGMAMECISGSRDDVYFEEKGNCLAEMEYQKLPTECYPVVSKPVDCSKDECSWGGSPPSTPSAPTPEPSTSTPAQEPKTPAPAPPTPTPSPPPPKPSSPTPTTMPPKQQPPPLVQSPPPSSPPPVSYPPPVRSPPPPSPMPSPSSPPPVQSTPPPSPPPVSCHPPNVPSDYGCRRNYVRKATALAAESAMCFLSLQLNGENCIPSLPTLGKTDAS
ncbi:hypothetical protein CUMW_185600 [Citrus unshiu]|nr:hypothetical protein CUMW_185600 [Citrus unshiu]